MSMIDRLFYSNLSERISRGVDAMTYVLCLVVLVSVVL